VILELRCRCGQVHGTFDAARGGTRALCYCRDCQAYARWLGRAEQILDREGGSDIVACLPSGLRIVEGEDALACISLGERGLLRWYARCCHTAIGNTPRDPRVSYLGLMRDFVAGGEAALGPAFGQPSLRINTASATAPVKSTKLGATAAMFGITTRLLVARVGGGWRDTPLFDAATGKPRRAPRVLTPVERRALEPAVRRP